MGKTCVICGKPSGMYPLCREHLEMKNNGEVVKCEDCGTWHLKKQPCKCQKSKYIKTTTTNNEQNDRDEGITCIICGQPSNGKHFCYDCWEKYKDKSIDIRIVNCKEIKILDQYGNLTICCDDGRKVRSRAEALISNFFYNNKIRSVYEKTIYYDDENGESKTLHPDFYLPDYGIYIEYNEIRKKSYLKSKEYVKKIYDKLGFKVIIMNDENLNDLAGFLKPLLKIN